MPIISVAEWSPICLSLGSVAIYWYGVAYVVGIFLALCYARFICRKFCPTLPPRVIDIFLPWACIGIIIGGRLGHVFFYEAAYYLQHPLQILYTRQGGMAFHGGMIGVILSLWLFSRKWKLPFPQLLDVCASAAPIGLCLGRLANFVNNELYGRPTTSWFGVYFRGAAGARHPTQIYEAFFEGLVLWALLRGAWNCERVKNTHGAISAIFLLFYGLFRTIIDLFKAPEASTNLAAGQALSVAMILAGVLWLVWLWRDKSKS